MLAELTETSSKHDGAPVEVPDFTRGAWHDLKPLGIEAVDEAFLNKDAKAGQQMNV